MQQGQEKLNKKGLIVYKVKLPEKSTAGVAGNPAIMDACFGCGPLAHTASGAVVPCSAARGTVVPLFIWPLLLFFPIYVLLVLYHHRQLHHLIWRQKKTIVKVYWKHL
jgi:hypothetical protein